MADVIYRVILKPTTSVSDARGAQNQFRGDGDSGEYEGRADQVVRVETEDGFVLWSRIDDLVKEHGRPSVSRGGALAWELDCLQFNRSGRYVSAERGAAGVGVKALKFVGFDLEQKVAGRLGAELETRQLGGEEGLFRCSLDDGFRLDPLGSNEDVSSDEPALVFIHGTASNARGSFGALWSLENDAGKALRVILKKQYGERVFAFQHRSLTKSPVQNALDLVEKLPRGARNLHLVSHSRGGLVGELLSLSGLKKGQLNRELIEKLYVGDHILAEQLGLSPLDDKALNKRNQLYEQDREMLLKLVGNLAERNVEVQRFVRVACPARGTTLASGRLDRWFSMLNFLMKSATGDGLFADAANFIEGITKQRTDPRTLPGLEAMMPGSGLTRLLQYPELETSADLSIIAGDIEGDSHWSRFKLIVADWFYGSDHDLVVNTGSMYGGLTRRASSARFLLDRGSAVNHFAYFDNKRTVDALLKGLQGDVSAFEPIVEAKQQEPRWRAAVRRSRDAATVRPLAVILPGVMGSAIDVRHSRIWLDYLAIAGGKLDLLRISQNDGAEPVDLLGDFYGPLIEYLAQTHRVEIFAYDWRKSIFEAANILGDRLSRLLPQAEHDKQPIRIVAHSMGGLVVRALLATEAGANLWRRCLALRNSRFLMLGTPNRGSYEAFRWLTGENPTQAKLALLDFFHDTNGIIDIVRNFPGLLELLPLPSHPDLAQAKFWSDLKQELGAGWTPADDARLHNASETWKKLEAAAFGSEGVVYVAGSQNITVSSHRVVKDDSPFGAGRLRLSFLGVREGDGTVTWESSRLKDVPIWYAANTAHDEMCNQSRWFNGYLELLEAGTTKWLSAVPPERARAAAETPREFVIPELPPTDDIPDRSALRSMGFATGRQPIPQDREPVGLPITVEVRHGDLSYAKHPVVVGHYAGDIVISAEQILDERLGYVLSRRSQLGLYPGPTGTHAVFFNQDSKAKPHSAIVVGLGVVGGLSPTLLQIGVRDALLEYAAQVAQGSERQFGPHGTMRSAAVSCLLVGSGAGGVSVKESVESILRAVVDANTRLRKIELADGGGERRRKLRQRSLFEKVQIDRIEFIELYEDMALEAAEAVGRVLVDGELADKVVWEEPRVVTSGQGGLTRLRRVEPAGWWQRLEILEQTFDETVVGLRFVATTDRARAEVTQSVGQLRLAESFIAEASSSAASNSETAKTLFEMLLPNRLKALAPNQGNLVLLVDEFSARYPWELLEDRWSERRMPPAVASGLVRQLKIEQYRERPLHASIPTALVVGDPDLKGWRIFPQLDGARNEARGASSLLRDNGYRVVESIGEDTKSIVESLHKDSWRILHLAGHGEHDFEITEDADLSGKGVRGAASQKRVCGMVIGPDTFLTPGDVEQMRYTPELVFINCCHLGQTTTARRISYSALAANLGVQFIRMGVKAVIAAGWAVDDEAASAFARSFYMHLLNGETFGDSVRGAREEIWLRFPKVNTWGAYQCYGDQSFRLQADGRPQRREQPRAYLSPSELIADLGNCRERIRMGAGEFREDISKEEKVALIARTLDRVPASAREQWLMRADIAAAAGFAYGELGIWDEAIRWLEIALKAEKGDCPVRVVEQIANFNVRWAADEWSQARSARGRVSDSNPYAEKIEKSIRDLMALNERAETRERLNLLGAAYKRKCLIEKDWQQRMEALQKAAHYYRLAFEKSGKSDSYSFTNWASAQLLADRAPMAAGRVGDVDFDTEANRVAALLHRETEKDLDFWKCVGIADTDLLRLLAVVPAAPAPTLKRPTRGKVPISRAKIAAGNTVVPHLDAGQMMRLRDAVINGYLRAMRGGASPREVRSVLENLDFLIEMLPRSDDPLRQSLQAIRDAVAAEVLSD